MDSVPGTAGNDNILGTVDEVTATANTFSIADVINGAGGNGDTLQITVADITGARTYTPTQVSNVENVRIINSDVSAFGVTVDLTATKGVTKAEASSSSSAVTFTNLESTSVTMSAVSNTAAVNFRLAADKLTGTSDTANISLSSNTGGVTIGAANDGAGFEAANITVAGTNSGALIGAGADIKTVTVSGSGSLVVGGGDLTAATLFDASAATGNITYDATAANATVKGGSGNDTLTDGNGNDVITSGAGNDTVTGGTGNDNIDAGAGDDRVVLTAVTKEDTIAGGDGTDTLSIATAIAYSAATSTNDGANISGFEVLRVTGASVTQNMLALETNNKISTVSAAAAGSAIQNGAIATVNSETGATGVVLGLKTNGTSDALAVNLGSAKDATNSTLTLGATQYETLNVASAGGANTLNLSTSNAGDGVTAPTAASATSLKTINVTGDKTLTISGSGVDKSLATVNAAGFNGDANTTLTVSNTGSEAAMTVTANGVYTVSVTTGKGADAVTTGSGNDTITTGDGADTITSGTGNDTISAGDGANSIVAGAGNDGITAGTGADYIDGGDGNDTVTAGDGANTVLGGAGIDNITTGTGADSVDGGEGNDVVVTGNGNDTVVGAAGDDDINVGVGNDSVVAGDGNDTITGNTGDDTLLGGAGNDIITIASLTNGDSVDGGDGTDRLTITAIASDATPRGISSIEDFRVTTFGVGTTTTGITVDFANVTGITSITTTDNTTNAGPTAVTNTIKNLPSTVTTINLADVASAANVETLAISYSSGPTSLRLNVNDVVNAATNITSLNAGLHIHGVLNTDLAGDARVFANGFVSDVGTVSTDATSLKVTSDSLVAGQGIGVTELTVGAVTSNVLQSLEITTSANADITVSSGDVTTTSPEFSSVKLSAATGSTLTVGEVVANSATAVTFTIDAANQGTVVVGNAISSFTEAAVTLSGTLGDQTALTTSGVIAQSITSSNFGVGAGATITLPALKVDSTTGTIGAVTVSAGAGSTVTQHIGDDTTAAKAASIGAITAQGSGTVKVVLYDTATAGTATASKQGAISAASMTSALSAFELDATDTAAFMTITGGSGNDTISGGKADDRITAGLGTDRIVLTPNGGTANTDTVVFSVGDSNAVVAAGDDNDTGGDSIFNFGIAGADTIRLNITSADTSWDIATHVAVGTATGTKTDQGEVGSFLATVYLAQAGAVAAGDIFDIAVNVFSTAVGGAGTAAFADAAAAQARTQVNLTGTVGDDTLVTGALSDTIDGGAGNDAITGGAGSDSLTGGAGNDVFNFAASSSTLTIGGSADAGTIVGFDVITDFRLGTAALVAESIDFSGVTEAVLANTAGVNGTDSTLTIGGNAVKSHAITGGIATFDDADTYAAALTLTSTAHLAAVVQYLQANDLGDAGATLAFTVGTDTYLFMQGDNGGTNSADLLIKLTGVSGTSISATNATTAGLIDIGGAG